MTVTGSTELACTDGDMSAGHPDHLESCGAAASSARHGVPAAGLSQEAQARPRYSELQLRSSSISSVASDTSSCMEVLRCVGEGSKPSHRPV